MDSDSIRILMEQCSVGEGFGRQENLDFIRESLELSEGATYLVLRNGFKLSS